MIKSVTSSVLNYRMHPAGGGILLASLLILGMALLLYPLLGLAIWVWILFLLYFLRAPEIDHKTIAHITKINGAVVSPAYGKVVHFSNLCALPGELHELCSAYGVAHNAVWKRVSIFLSPLDIHVTYMPVVGEVCGAVYQPGTFHGALFEKASVSNERQTFLCRLNTAPKKDHDGGESNEIYGSRSVLSDDGFMAESGRQELMSGNVDSHASLPPTYILCSQIAGLLARRIVPPTAPFHTTLIAGREIGMILFGSRVDVYVPQSYHWHVRLGERVHGPYTLLASPLSKA